VDDRLLQRWIEWQGQPQEHINTWTLRGLAAPAKPKREHINRRDSQLHLHAGQGIEMAARIVNELTADAGRQARADRRGLPRHVLPDAGTRMGERRRLVRTEKHPALPNQSGTPTRWSWTGTRLRASQGHRDNPDSPAAAPIVLVKTPGKDLYTIADGWHRTSAYKVLGKASIQAFVGVMDTDEGDWDVAMHNAKLNTDTAADDQRTESTGPAMNVRFEPRLVSRLSVKELEAIADKLSLL